MKLLKVAILPIEINLGDKAGNMQAFTDIASSIDADTDLLVLPELFSTGFSSKKELLSELAESNGSKTIAQIHAVSKMHNVAICGSFLAKTGTNIYNRAFFIEPSGDEVFYDKKHLFSMSNEARCINSGNSRPPVVRYRGWNINIVVCYDLRFPVWCRNVSCAYDLLIIPANWPDSREYAWSHLLKARAIENQAYVIGANRSGRDKFGNYDGMTMALDYCGKELPLTAKRGAIYTLLDHTGLEQWREDFSAWKDADTFTLTDN